MAGLRVLTWLAFICAAAAGPATPAVAAPVTLHCTAYGGSHTVRMTFDYDRAACRLYWREVKRFLPLEDCRQNRLKARKPFSKSRDSHVVIDLQTMAFIDRFGGVEDRGRCKASGKQSD